MCQAESVSSPETFQVNSVCVPAVLLKAVMHLSGPRERRQVLFLVCGEDGCLDGQRGTESRGERRTRELQ